MTTLRKIDEKINELLGSVDTSGVPPLHEEDTKEEEQGTNGDPLLNGPQLAANAMSQDEIDRLLSEFDD
jgi:hypothetical protein